MPHWKISFAKSRIPLTSNTELQFGVWCHLLAISFVSDTILRGTIAPENLDLDIS